MSQNLPAALLGQLNEFIAANLGLNFPPERATDLERGVRSAAQEFKFDDAEACVRWLLSGPLSRTHVEILADNLTIGETYFFRDKKAFGALEQHVLPELIRSRREAGVRRLRIWSAACCSGEEAYSLAIAVRRALPDLANWQVEILGTDIAPRFLQKAAKGIFSDWSFRDTPDDFKESYFTKTAGGHWLIRPEIRRMVTFAHLNLMAGAYPGLVRQTDATDVVFCRNALIYFPQAQAARVIRNLADCLIEGGWLVLGPNEISNVSSSDLVSTRFPGAILHRKDSSKAPAANRSLPSNREERPSPSTTPLGKVSEVHMAAELPEACSASVAASLAETAGSTDLRVSVLLVRALADQGRLADSLVFCDRLIAADKMNPLGHYLRASILQELGLLPDAATSFKRALYLEPEFVLAHFALGHLMRSQGKFADADRYFDNALMLARRHSPEEILPEAEGLTAGRLAEIITVLRQTNAVA